MQQANTIDKLCTALLRLLSFLLFAATQDPVAQPYSVIGEVSIAQGLSVVTSGKVTGGATCNSRIHLRVNRSCGSLNGELKLLWHRSFHCM